MNGLFPGEKHQVNGVPNTNKTIEYQSVDASASKMMRQSNSLAKLRPTGGSDLLSVNHHQDPRN